MTPEGAAKKAITQYLQACRLGKVERINVGALRVGEAPKHPWVKDTRRLVSFGRRGASDLVVHLAGDPREIHVEVKPLGWHAPNPPKPGASKSTHAKYQHYVDQERFQAEQRARGHFAFFARSPWEVYEQLLALGFKNLPVPAPDVPQDRRRRRP